MSTRDRVDARPASRLADFTVSAIFLLRAPETKPRTLCALPARSGHEVLERRTSLAAE